MNSTEIHQKAKDHWIKNEMRNKCYQIYLQGFEDGYSQKVENQIKVSKSPSAEKILFTVCDYYQIDISEMKSLSRKGYLARAKTAFFTIGKISRLKLRELAEATGLKNHSSYYNYIGKANNTTFQNIENEIDELCKMLGIIV